MKFRYLQNSFPWTTKLYFLSWAQNTEPFTQNNKCDSGRLSRKKSSKFLRFLERLIDSVNML